MLYQRCRHNAILGHLACKKTCWNKPKRLGIGNMAYAGV